MYYNNISLEALLNEYENGNLTNLSNLSKARSKKIKADFDQNFSEDYKNNSRKTGQSKKSMGKF
ncbi:hypothetical protein ABF87_11920 [Nitrosomonas sp. JL21]|nr:hypothetical protein [Nitrosomonas sp. JL21]